MDPGQMERPLVSTIVPVFNGERFLGEAIESALAQDYRPHEVIVIDDASIDGSSEIAAGFPGVKLVRLETNGGPAVARNAGIAASSGEFIALLDADDLMAPGRLSAQIGFLLEHPDADAVLGTQRVIVEPGAVRPTLNPLVDPDQLPAQAEAEAISYYGGTLVARRAAYEQVGLYDETFRVGEDVDWMLRARDLGLRISTLDEVFVHRRIHGGNLTYDRAAGRQATLRAFKRRIERKRAEAAQTR